LGRRDRARDRSDAAVTRPKAGYGAWVLRNHEFPSEVQTIREAITAAICEPSAKKITGAGLLIYATREFTEPSPELEDFLIDIAAILKVEREWLFNKETQA